MYPDRIGTFGTQEREGAGKAQNAEIRDSCNSSFQTYVKERCRVLQLSAKEISSETRCNTLQHGATIDGVPHGRLLQAPEARTSARDYRTAMMPVSTG